LRLDGGKPARTGRKRPKSDLKSMKIAARNKVDAHEAAKAASGRVIQMILNSIPAWTNAGNFPMRLGREGWSPPRRSARQAISRRNGGNALRIALP
ncbi:hypothetical protein, partial [Pseudomonas aeruginosa]|uniref:hypothetical protein n=1 Tax=Pseudomonas aeruginosa TaxID=287 RepID=UPI001EEB093E